MLGDFRINRKGGIDRNRAASISVSICRPTSAMATGSAVVELTRPGFSGIMSQNRISRSLGLRFVVLRHLDLQGHRLIDRWPVTRYLIHSARHSHRWTLHIYVGAVRGLHGPEPGDKFGHCQRASSIGEYGLGRCATAPVLLPAK